MSPTRRVVPRLEGSGCGFLFSSGNVVKKIAAEDRQILHTVAGFESPTMGSTGGAAAGRRLGVPMGAPAGDRKAFERALEQPLPGQGPITKRAGNAVTYDPAPAVADSANDVLRHIRFGMAEAVTVRPDDDSLRALAETPTTPELPRSMPQRIPPQLASARVAARRDGSTIRFNRIR